MVWFDVSGKTRFTIGRSRLIELTISMKYSFSWLAISIGVGFSISDIHNLSIGIWLLVRFWPLISIGNLTLCFEFPTHLSYMFNWLKILVFSISVAVFYLILLKLWRNASLDRSIFHCLWILILLLSKFLIRLLYQCGSFEVHFSSL